MKTLKVNSAATTNATRVLPPTGVPVSIWRIIAFNSGVGAAFLKIYETMTGASGGPVVGTDIPVMTLAIPAGGNVILDGSKAAFEFGKGFGYAITGAAADTDTTAVAAGQVKVLIGYGG